MVKRYLIGILALGLAPLLAHAQITKDATYKVESAATVSGGESTPLWLNANKHGVSSLDKQNGYIRAGVFRPMEADKEFTYGYGIDMVGGVNFDSKVTIQQAYLDLEYKKMRLSIGSKERVGELVNDELSSGALTLSSNARPVPQVWAGLPNYISVPGTNHWVSFRGHIAYGRFMDNAWQRKFAPADGRYTSDVLYHSKALYVKVGDKPNCPLTFEGGIEMNAQFGGTAYNYNGPGTKFTMPTGLSSYLKAFIPLSGGKDTPESDQLNVEGNVVGSWHASLAYKLNNGYKIRGYFEHYFEDHSMLFMEYPWKDGLIGMELTLPKNRWVDAVVYEYIASRDQAGPVYWDHTEALNVQISARDDYYNHGFYNSWQHAGQAMGNPLFTSPIYNKDGSITFKSNRLLAHHLGISGTPTSELHYRMLLSYSSNWGTYGIPFQDIKYNTSALAEVTYKPKKLSGWNFTAALALDRGAMLGNNKGMMIKVSKTGLFTK